MIATLTGTLTHIGEADAIIETAGVGYRVQASSRCLARIGGAGGGGGVGSEVSLMVETHFRDDRIVLTGFADAATRDAFNLLLTVQGVGSKAALAILSALPVNDLILAIAAGDKAMITRAEGVGAKIASRIINELADKTHALEAGGLKVHDGGDAIGVGDSGGGATGDAISALVNLGYGRSEAHGAVMLVARGNDAAPVEQLVPLALKELGR